MATLIPIIIEFEGEIRPELLTKHGIIIKDTSKLMLIVHAEGTKEQIKTLSDEKDIKIISLSAKLDTIG